MLITICYKPNAFARQTLKTYRELHYFKFQTSFGVILTLLITNVTSEPWLCKTLIWVHRFLQFCVRKREKPKSRKDKRHLTQLFTSNSLHTFFLALWGLGSNCGRCLLSRSAAAASLAIWDSRSMGVNCSEVLLPGLELEDGGHEGTSSGE